MGSEQFIKTHLFNCLQEIINGRTLYESAHMCNTTFGSSANLHVLLLKMQEPAGILDNASVITLYQVFKTQIPTICGKRKLENDRKPRI